MSDAIDRSKPRVAILGLGIMGTNMARRVLAAGFPLTVYNRGAEKARSLAADGASVAATPHDAAARANIVLTMLADDTAARAVWLGDDGAIAGASEKSLLIESSTVTVGWIRELAEASARRGCELLDAPVTGSKAQSAAGELNFLVGGSGAALERARPLLLTMGRSITHLGPTGSGALVKLINNFLCGVQAASLAEAIVWTERAGLDLAKVLPVLADGAPGSPMVKTLAARMSRRDFSPNFLLKLLAKDVSYAATQSADAHANLTTAEPALAMLNDAIAAGYGEKDMSAVIELLRNRR